MIYLTPLIMAAAIVNFVNIEMAKMGEDWLMLWHQPIRPWYNGGDA